MSQPPPQKVMSRPKSRFSAVAVHAFAADLHRVDASRPASMRSGNNGRTPPQQWSITLTSASSLARLPHAPMAGLEELTIHARRDLGAGLHAQVVAEKDDVDIGTDQAEVLLQVSQCLGQAFEQVVGLSGSAARRARKLSFRYRNWPVIP